VTRDHPDVLTKVLQILEEVCPERNVKATRSEQASLIDDYYIDSLKVAELSLLLEEAFDVSVFLPHLIASVRDPHDLTVGALADFIRSNLNEPA
jgi:acyl carrier protein